MHIDLLNEIYLLTQNEDERFVLKTEINNYIARQKEIADNIIEYEYYNKYALEKVVLRLYFMIKGFKNPQS
jgi:spore coat protein CotF